MSEGTFEATSSKFGNLALPNKTIRFDSSYGELRIIATNDKDENSNQTVILTLTHEAIKIGTHSVSEHGKASTTFGYRPVSYLGISGEIKITELDLEKQHVKGSFSFETLHGGGVSGHFDLNRFRVSP